MCRLSILFLLVVCRIAASAQVPVSQEPRHRPVFQNDKIRILNVLLPPGDTTQYHVHSTPSLFLFFTSTTTGSQLQGSQPSTGRSTAGTLLFENLAPPHERIHRVWNLDAGTFHVMDIELLSKDSGFAKQSSLPAHLAKVVDTPWVHAYQFVLGNGEAFTIRKNVHSLLIIALDAARMRLQKGRATEEQITHQGTFFWIPAGQRFALNNLENTTARFALIEIP
jgi:quercetin dioxygenase-like cupin family protein